MFVNLPIIGLSPEQVEYNHIDLSKFKFKIPKTRRWEKEIYCNSFDDLTTDQKADIAERFLRQTTISLENGLVNYVLSKGWEDQEAPFSWDDVTNHHRFGRVTLNDGYEHELSEDEREEREEKQEYLVDKWYNYYSETLTTALDDLETQQSDLDEDDFKSYEDYDRAYEEFNEKIEAMQDRYNRAEVKHSELDNILDEIKSLDCDEEHEIYQWFCVGSDLANWLEAEGECTLDGSFWGRTCCGIGLEYESVIQRIAFSRLHERLN